MRLALTELRHDEPDHVFDEGDHATARDGARSEEDLEEGAEALETYFVR